MGVRRNIQRKTPSERKPVYECASVQNISFPFGFLDTENSSVTVVVDAGHGQTLGQHFDSGAIRGGVLESDVTAREAIEVANKLREAGYRVVLTNDEQAPKRFDSYCEGLQHRVRITQDVVANSVGKFLFISLHADVAANARMQGVRIYSQHDHGGSAAFAAIAALAFNGMDREMNAATEKGDYYVLRNNSNIPSLLIETGFLTHPKDRRNLTDPEYHKKIAEGVVSAVQNFAPIAPRKPNLSTVNMAASR